MLEEDFEDDEFDESLDEDEIAMREQERLSLCTCGAWQWSEKLGEYVNAADCCCGAE